MRSGKDVAALGLVIAICAVLSVLLAPILWPFWLRDHRLRKRKDRVILRRWKIDRARGGQPVEELRRKALKARRRQNIYTQEEIDLANAEAREICERIRSGTT